MLDAPPGAGVGHTLSDLGNLYSAYIYRRTRSAGIQGINQMIPTSRVVPRVTPPSAPGLATRRAAAPVQAISRRCIRLWVRTLSSREGAPDPVCPQPVSR